MHDPQDHWFHEAKREGYLSRAAWKLIEIDDRRRLLQSGSRVLDLGAAPGSWLQVVTRRIGTDGLVVGIDPRPIEHRFEHPGVRVIEGALAAVSDEAIAAACDAAPSIAFDVILSDMAPSTTGDRTIDHHASVRLGHEVLDRCAALLKPGGALVLKVFEGEAYAELMARAQRMFTTAKGVRPKASRAVSREMYVVATDRRDAIDAPEGPAPVRARPEPPPGWHR